MQIFFVKQELAIVVIHGINTLCRPTTFRAILFGSVFHQRNLIRAYEEDVAVQLQELQQLFGIRRNFLSHRVWEPLTESTIEGVQWNWRFFVLLQNSFEEINGGLLGFDSG